MGDHEPNEYGFAGEPAMPEVRPDLAGQNPAEEIAVPDDDLTWAVSEGLTDPTDADGDPDPSDADTEAPHAEGG